MRYAFVEMGHWPTVGIILCVFLLVWMLMPPGTDDR